MKGSIAALAFGCLLLPDALACSCPPITLKKSADDAHSVYLATLQEARLVSDSRNDSASIEGKFLIYKTLKGRPSTEVMVLRTPPDGGSCGVEMMVAAKYVIFKRNDSDGIIACGGSGVLGHFGPLSRWGEDELSAEVRKATQKTRR